MLASDIETVDQQQKWTTTETSKNQETDGIKGRVPNLTTLADHELTTEVDLIHKATEKVCTPVTRDRERVRVTQSIVLLPFLQLFFLSIRLCFLVSFI